MSSLDLLEELECLELTPPHAYDDDHDETPKNEHTYTISDLVHALSIYDESLDLSHIANALSPVAQSFENFKPDSILVEVQDQIELDEVDDQMDEILEEAKWKKVWKAIQKKHKRAR